MLWIQKGKFFVVLAYFILGFHYLIEGLEKVAEYKMEQTTSNSKNRTGEKGHQGNKIYKKSIKALEGLDMKRELKDTKFEKSTQVGRTRETTMNLLLKLMI